MQTVTDFDVFLENTSEKLTIFVRDPRTGILTDVVTDSTFKLIDLTNDSAVVNVSFPPEGNSTITHSASGVYHYNLNTSTYGNEYLANFRCILTNDVLNNNVYARSVPAKYFKYAAILRSQVDKARKSVVDYIENMDRNDEDPIRFFYGYDDKHLIFYLERGVQYINLFPPYTALTVDTFPFSQFGGLMIDAATIAALEAQGIFAIDTDYDYSLGGNSFSVSHFGNISSMLASLLGRFSEQVSALKKLYLTKGAVLYQFTPGGVREMRYLSSLPSGFWSRLLSGFTT